MKKLLAMVLALVMTLSLAVVGSNAAFKDADKVNETYAEAVDVLAGMKVFQGYTDGSFQPEGAITRAEVAAIVYRLYTGDVSDKQASLYATYNKFTDMNGAAWAAGYIGYCANAGLIKGYDAKTFGPSDKVTGYQALAMILRAVGYDAQGEFTGADWQLHVAQTAQQAGVLVNIKGVDLNAAASRELVAELLFRTAATVPCVKYTPAFGYVANTVVGAQKTLGEQNFSLKVTNGTEDDFGRPSRTWAYTTGDKKTVVAQVADATYTTKVDECDIAKDLGLTKETKIEGAFIDGKAEILTADTVTTNRYATINPKATTSYVGAQGRITEVYDMGTDGIRLVEINTYFAQVTAVKAAVTDRNGHVTAATATFAVYQTKGNQSTVSYTFETEGFTVSQYALVKIVDPTNTNATKRYMTEAVAATATASDALKGWTSSTTTLGTTAYNDADKFICGNSKNVSNIKKSYDVYVDQFGNVIALTDAVSNFLVVEGINWVPDGTVYGGKAIANVVLADGTRVEGVTVATVNGKAVNNSVDSGVLTKGKPADAVVVAYAQNNAEYYKHLTTYSINADGSYNLGYNGNSFCAANDMNGATISTGTSTIKSSTNSVVVNSNTVFLVADKPGEAVTTYTTYNKSNVPAMTNATLCYLTDTAGWATVVLVTNYTLASNSFVAYVPADNTVVGNYVSGKGYEYNVYKLGETTATPVYFDTYPLITDGQDGFYTLTINSDNVVTAKTWFMGTYDGATNSGSIGKVGDYQWARAYVKSTTAGGLQTVDKASQAIADYDTISQTVTYILVDKYNGLTTLTGDAAASVVKDAKVVIAYSEDVYGNKLASYVYVISDSAATPSNPDADKSDVKALAGKGTVTVGGTVVDIVDNAYVSAELAVKNAKTLTGYTGTTMSVAVSNTNDWVALGAYDNATIAAQATLPTNSGSNNASNTYALSAGKVILVAYSENYVNYYVAYVIG